MQVSFCRRANPVRINSNLSTPENNLSRKEFIVTKILLKQKEILFFAMNFSTSKPLCKQYTIKKKRVLQIMSPPRYKDLAYHNVNMLIVTCGQYKKGIMSTVCRNMKKHKGEKQAELGLQRLSVGPKSKHLPDSFSDSITCFGL